ncbi:MAG: hypothetical protein Tsb0014_19200 [Pleurocapsa sp.]
MNTSAKVRHILVIEDPAVKRTVSLENATYSIGRHSSNDIVLSCQKTSRNHATLLRRTDVKTNKYSYWILDGDLQGNRSRNGIYVNDRKCLVHELKHGDAIRFSGDARAKYNIISNLAEFPEEINDNAPAENAINQQLISSQKTVLSEENSIASRETLTSNISFSEPVKVTSFAELSPIPIIEIDLYGKITYINSAAIINFKDIHQKQAEHPLLENLISQFNSRESNLLSREVKIDSRFFQQNSHYLPETKVIRSYILDITKEKVLGKNLKENQSLYQNILKQVTEGILIINGATKKIIEVNRAACECLGYPAEEILKMTIYELSFEEEKFARILQKIVVENSNFSGIALFRHQNGSIVNTNLKIDLIDSGEVENFCVIFHNNSSQTTNFSVDALAVNLTKRDVFHEQLVTAIANAKRSQKLLAVMFFSLDFLPSIQETLGYEKSNQLLSNLAERLRSSLRSGDTVTHWKEGIFALLMPQISGIEEAAKITQRLQNTLGESFKLGDKKFSITTHIGIAIYPQDGTEIDTLLKNANIALHRTQKSNSNFQFHSETMNSQAAVMLELEKLLHHALERNEFQLYYQPQINVKTGKIKGIEALLRWEHPELGLVSPSSFLKLAEQTGLIIPIGEWVIRTACRQNKLWQSQGLPPLKVAVNLSVVQFQQPNFVATIKQILAETQLDPSLLELEISASILMEDMEYSRYILSQLKKLGVYISIEDFAIGFSSLESLKQLPFNTLKIDRAFVQELSDNPQDLAIVSALVELGKGFNLRVVAEGVETRQQIELLRSLNCEQMQGFWFSRPLAVEEATKLLPFNYDEDEENEHTDNSHSLDKHTK